jgi:hypothetical protein
MRAGRLGLFAGRPRGRVAGTITVTWRSGFEGGAIPAATATSTGVADLSAPSSMGAVTYAILSDPSSLFTIVGSTLVLSATIAAGSSANVSIRATGTTKTADKTIQVASPTALAAPVNTVLPTISGQPAQGQVLTASLGAWAGNPTPTYSYQWQAADISIAGATASTFTPTASEVGKALTVIVTATNSVSSASAISAPTNPVAAAVTLSALTLSTLSATASSLYSATISGKSTGSTVTATSSDGTILTVVGASVTGTFSASGSKTITLVETLSGAVGSPKTTTLTVTVAVAPDTTAPTITSASTASGTAGTGGSITLTADEPVTWSLTGAGASNYTLSGNTLSWSVGLGAGTYPVSLIATDTVGNASTKTFTLTLSVAGSNYLLLVAGQSDAISRGTTGATIPSGIAAIDTSRVKIWNAGAWAGYVAGTNSSQTLAGTSAFPTCWGPEAEYARLWLADHPTGTLYIVKATADGTHLASSSGSTWYPSASGNLWSKFVTLVNAAKANLTTNSVSLASTDGIWNQGGSDALDDPSYADLYYTNLTLLLTAFHGIGANRIAVAKLGLLASLPYAATVRNGQNVAVSKDASAFLVETDDLTLSDIYHVNAAGIVIEGSRSYDAIKNGTTVEVADNTAPVFTSATTATSNENTQTVMNVTATDTGGSGVITYSIVGGADQAKFTIGSSSGVLSFITPPDYETPTDSGTNNVYDVQVRATDLAGNFANQSIAVTVANVAEGGAEDTDVTAFFSSVSGAGLTAPTTAQRAAYDTFVKAAKAGTNWWAECDVIRLLWSYDRAVSRRNVKQDLYHATESGTVTWAANAGFNTAGTGKLASTYNPTGGGSSFLQNDAHYGFWTSTNNTSASADFGLWNGSAGSFAISRNTSSNVQARVSQAANLSSTGGTITDGSGDWVFNRTGASALEYFRNAGSVLTGATASAAVTSATEELGGLSTGPYTSRVYRAVTIGGSLTSAQVSQRNTDLANFFTAIASA